MATTLGNRLAQLVLTTLGALVAIFVLLRIVPGDPAAAMLGGNATADAVAALRAQMGLDKPLYAQFADYVVSLAHFDLGRSLALHTSVSSLVLTAVGPTLAVAAGGLVVSLMLGIPLGLMAALGRGTRLDYAATVAALLGISVPGFVWALLLLLLFSVQWRIFPSAGAGTTPVEGLRALVLPSLATGLFAAGLIARITRSSMLTVLSQDFVRTARAKGLPPSAVLRRHTLRNALIPVLTVIGLNVTTLLQGALIVELVFNRPGLGRLALDAINARDYVVLQGFMIMTVIVVALVNIGVDILYGAVDPRLRA
ncbi:MAG: ABC transporter permease [Chloroflexi bacterium]|nr:ABC transporter permease [Chloroflexota bacterium]